MKVLQVVEASFAGVGRHVMDLSRHLIASGLEVHLAYGSARVDGTFLAGARGLGFSSVVTFNAGGPAGVGHLKIVRRLRSLVASLGVDVVHGHAARGGALARLAATGTQSRVAYTPNALITQAPHIGRSQYWFFRGLEVAMAPRTDALIYVSDEEERHGLSLGLRPRAQYVIPNGIDRVGAPDREKARAGLGLVGDALTIGFVGRLSPQKNVGLLLDGFEKLTALPGLAGVELVIVGEGQEESMLRTMARNAAAGSGSKIHFLGHQDGPAAMRAFDVFALPSKYEGFPYVLLEALSAGIPCVATTGCSAERLLGDGAAGLIVDDHAFALADGLASLLRNESRRRSASLAAETVAAKFSAAGMSSGVIDVYRSLCSGPG